MQMLVIIILMFDIQTIIEHLLGQISILGANGYVKELEDTGFAVQEGPRDAHTK